MLEQTMFLTLLILLALTTLQLGSAASVNNLARGNGAIYASTGSDGIIVLDASTAAENRAIPLPPGFSGIHDLAVDADLLFALDAIGGAVGVFSIASAEDPSFINGSTQDVSVAPFSGVSAGGGIMVVSGGTGSMSVFSYTSAGALTRLTDSIDLGTGQPDVLVDNEGSYAYVSTDFSGLVDDAGFGITTVDLNPGGLSNPSIERVGLNGAGFTANVLGPANFPIESAISGDLLLVAHAGGLSILSLEDRGKPSLTTTLPLDFPAVNVDADGDTAIVVGGESTPAAARVNLTDNRVENIDLPQTEGAGSATGVSIFEDTLIIAAGPVIVCEDCAQFAPPGEDGAESSSDPADDGSESGSGGDDGDDSDVCVEEAYLLSRGVARSALLHRGSMGKVLCPGHGLPCGTPSHVVRFGGSYMTYQELCSGAVTTCRADRKVVNGVSIRHARLLCGADEENCVVPHVMRTGFELERALIGALHRRIVAH